MDEITRAAYSEIASENLPFGSKLIDIKEEVFRKYTTAPCIKIEFSYNGENRFTTIPITPKEIKRRCDRIKIHE